MQYIDMENWEGKLPKHIQWWDLFVNDLSVEMVDGNANNLA